MTFTSTIQVLKVDDVVTRKSPKDGSDYKIHTAQTALLSDDGEIEKVGRLRIPEGLIEKIKVGTFRASFSLEVAQWGQNKGDVIAQLVDLLPVGPSRASSVPLAAKTV